MVVLVLLDNAVGAVIELLVEGHHVLSGRLRHLRRVDGIVGKVVRGRDVGAPVSPVVADAVVGVVRLLIL